MHFVNDLVREKILSICMIIFTPASIVSNFILIDISHVYIEKLRLIVRLTKKNLFLLLLTNQKIIYDSSLVRQKPKYCSI
jgi:hypothetical protein